MFLPKQPPFETLLTPPRYPGWPVGQLGASLIGWGFLGSHYDIDKGWRCKSSSGASNLSSANLLSRLRLYDGSHDVRYVPFSISSVPPFRVAKVSAQQRTPG
jgi:hypothetical protein